MMWVTTDGFALRALAEFLRDRGIYARISGGYIAENRIDCLIVHRYGVYHTIRFRNDSYSIIAEHELNRTQCAVLSVNLYDPDGFDRIAFFMKEA